MFLHLCVIFSRGGAGGWLSSMHHRSHDWGLHPEGWSASGASTSGGSASRGKGVCIQGERGSAYRGGDYAYEGGGGRTGLPPVLRPPKTGKVRDTLPTGMLLCFINLFD